MLDMYDARAEEAANEKARKAVPRQLAEQLDQSDPGKYGASAEAIQKHLRGLLEKREHAAEKARQIGATMSAALRKAERAYKKLLDESSKKSRDK